MIIAGCEILYFLSSLKTPETSFAYASDFNP